MFTVRGLYGLDEAHVTWDDGRITSDDPVLANAVTRWAAYLEGAHVIRTATTPRRTTCMPSGR